MRSARFDVLAFVVALVSFGVSLFLWSELSHQRHQFSESTGQSLVTTVPTPKNLAPQMPTLPSSASPLFTQDSSSRDTVFTAVNKSQDELISQLQEDLRQLRQEQAITKANQVATGRYVYYQHPQIRADQYLLDTATGRMWQHVVFTDRNDKPGWSEVEPFAR